ncbi:unnamed protein product [Sphagnum jensenii]|uniref:Haloacid dehalogenase-like hydrolase n=1 Tax=Sphagnum jensenii TaxID=128206 RepID=A0ABP1AF60_9BRYO
MARRVLITFDVDGTLMQSTGPRSNSLHRRAFSAAFLQVFGVEGSIDVITHHGSTDPLIILNTLEYYGIPQETAAPKLPELKAKMVEYAKQHSSEVGEGLEILPGVLPLLDALSRRNDVIIGLVTGNLEEIGWLKMEALGIRQFFSVPNFGGFGSDDSNRGELVKIAACRAEQSFPGGFRLHAHVGDTPNDIQAAEYGGAVAIGVCTGIFSREVLHEASHKEKPAIILENLTNIQNFLSVCGLPEGDF